jgi:hypothetical protein
MHNDPQVMIIGASLNRAMDERFALLPLLIGGYTWMST